MNDRIVLNGWPDPLNAWGVNGGRVQGNGPFRLEIDSALTGYTNAQLDDTSGRPRRRFLWRPGMRLSLRARFSRPLNELHGTAGFGFWNAPFGDPRHHLPALPRAIWFFMGGPRSDFPINPAGPGRGFYTATIDAARPRALLMAPLAPLVMLLNRWPRFRRSVWPRVQQRLGMSYRSFDHVLLTSWHTFQIEWRLERALFWIDGEMVHETTQSPRGPLGFVCWLDNQYLQLTPTGRFAAGTVKCPAGQVLEIADLAIKKIA